MIQLSVPVHPGDCGGFIADVRGRLIGIVHSTFSADDASPEAGLLRLFNKEGRDLWPASPTPLVFATPVDTIEFVAERIIQHRKMVRGRIGISAKSAEGGVEIVKIEVGSPARKAGLRKGDVLVSCDGEAIPSVAALQKKIERLEEPRVFKMRILRGGVSQDVDVRVEIEGAK
jgi:putative serine protease PepD